MLLRPLASVYSTLALEQVQFIHFYFDHSLKLSGVSIKTNLTGELTHK